jgi:hypothetical protein
MRFSRLGLLVLALILLAASLALAKENEKPNAVKNNAAISSRDLRGGFGRPETITGTISMVKPEEGIVVLAVRGSSQAPSAVVVVVHSKTVHDRDAVISEEQITAVPGPGETDFSLRVARSTLIKVDGQPLAWGELPTLKGREATVRFVPRRAGNFALGIEVG